MNRLAHDLECSSVYRPGLECTCAVGVLMRLREWKPGASERETAKLIGDARDYMRRLIELFNEAYNPE